jgi:hypothetical protein
VFKRKVQAAYIVVVADVDVASRARKWLDKFFPEYSLPTPTIKLVRHTDPKWNGRTTYSSKDPSTTTIELQKRILGDERSLDRVLVHELIHHVDFIVNKGGEGDAHGKFFKEQAERINAIMGEGYVTETSDASIVAEDKLVDFYVLITPAYNKKGYMFAKALQPSPKQKKYIDQEVARGAKVVKSRDRKFLGRTADIGKGWSVPKDDDWQDLLKRLYEGEGS